MYAIVQIKGHQYKVSPGDTITVDRLTSLKGEVVQFAEVLFVSDAGTVTVGTPFVPDVSVAATVVDNIQGEKIRVARFKAKSRYRRVRGFRAQQTVLTIVSIGSTDAPKAATKKTVKAPTRTKSAKKV